MIWGADLLARKEKLGLLADWRHMLVPLMPGAGLLAMLVMAGDDLGTTFVLVIIFLTLLWVAGRARAGVHPHDHLHGGWSWCCSR